MKAWAIEHASVSPGGEKTPPKRKDEKRLPGFSGALLVVLEVIALEAISLEVITLDFIALKAVTA